MMLILIYACVILNIAPFAYPFVFHRPIPSLITVFSVFCVHVIFFLLLRKLIKSNAISPKTKTAVLSTSVPMIVLTDMFAGFFMSFQSLLWAIVGICIIVGYFNKMPALSKTASKRFIIVLVILNIVTYLLAFLIFPIFNLLGLLLLLSNFILVPAFFCGCAKRLAESAGVSRKCKTVVILTSVLLMIAADIVACIIKFQGILIVCLPAKGVWWLFCGVWAILNYHLDRPNVNKKAVKILTWVFAAVSLILTAFIFLPFTPGYEQVKNEALLILPFLLGFTSVTSYRIGKIVSEPYRIIKLSAWFFANLLLQLVIVLSLFGTLSNPGAVITWVAAFVSTIIWYIMGTVFKKRRESSFDNASETLTQGKVITVTLCLTVFVVMIFSVLLLYLGGMLSRVYNDDISVQSPDGQYTIIIKEWESYESSGVEIYGVKGSSPNLIEKLMPEKLGEASAVDTYFKKGAYEIEWAEKNIIIRYDVGRADGEWSVLYLDYPDNTSIYIKFTVLVAAVVVVIAVVVFFAVRAERKRKKIEA